MKGHKCVWNIPGTSPPGREGLSGPGEASWPPISTSWRFKSKSWSQLLAHPSSLPPCRKPYGSDILVTHHFSDPLGFLRPGGLSTLEVPPSTCSFILIHLGRFHPPIFQSFHQMLYFPGSLLCTAIQRSSLLHGKIPAPDLSASYSLYHIHSTKIYVFCTPNPVLGSRDVAVGNGVCVCTLGVGGVRGGMGVEHTVTQINIFANCVKCSKGIRGLWKNCDVCLKDKGPSEEWTFKLMDQLELLVTSVKRAGRSFSWRTVDMKDGVFEELKGGQWGSRGSEGMTSSHGGLWGHAWQAFWKMSQVY